MPHPDADEIADLSARLRADLAGKPALLSEDDIERIQHGLTLLLDPVVPTPNAIVHTRLLAAALGAHDVLWMARGGLHILDPASVMPYGDALAALEKLVGVLAPSHRLSRGGKDGR